jgi:hypothetical protein
MATAIFSGNLRLPSKPALSWMFSAEQKLISDTGQPAGRWRRHIMIYYPYLPPMPGGDGGAPTFLGGMVSGAGTSQSSSIIPVSEFVHLKHKPPESK